MIWGGLLDVIEKRLQMTLLEQMMRYKDGLYTVFYVIIDQASGLKLSDNVNVREYKIQGNRWKHIESLQFSNLKLFQSTKIIFF